jgi:SAM-dependent methyltransferase
MNLEGFVASSRDFQIRLAQLKAAHPLEPPGWYPYDSLSGVSVLERLLSHDYPLLPPVMAFEPVLDLGCGDGDLAFYMESLGAEVDAVDYAETNFNQLAGAHRLRELLGSRVNLYSLNLDWYFELPRASYGLVVFLGTLYHLKNPFYVLERLARSGAYCLLSTRVARVAPGGVPLEQLPVAYLLDPREANDDSTNYWIFSPAGLTRLAERAGWSVIHAVSAGCPTDSNPVDAEADERMFLLLKSRVRYPDFHVRLLEGWHPVEDDGWRWTEKRFRFEVLLPRRRALKEFALAFAVPEPLVPVEVDCEVDGQPAGRLLCAKPGAHNFRGVLPDPGAGRAEFHFRVRHNYRPPENDRRELGVRIPFTDPQAGARSGLPFRLS